MFSMRRGGGCAGSRQGMTGIMLEAHRCGLGGSHSAAACGMMDPVALGGHTAQGGQRQ